MIDPSLRLTKHLKAYRGATSAGHPLYKDFDYGNLNKRIPDPYDAILKCRTCHGPVHYFYFGAHGVDPIEFAFHLDEPERDVACVFTKQIVTGARA